MHIKKKKAAASHQPSFCGLKIWITNLAKACYKGQKIDKSLLDFGSNWSCFSIDSNTSKQYSATGF